MVKTQAGVPRAQDAKSSSLKATIRLSGLPTGLREPSVLLHALDLAGCPVDGGRAVFPSSLSGVAFVTFAGTTAAEGVARAMSLDGRALPMVCDTVDAAQTDSLMHGGESCLVTPIVSVEIVQTGRKKQRHQQLIPPSASNAACSAGHKAHDHRPGRSDHVEPARRQSTLTLTPCGERTVRVSIDWDTHDFR